MYFDGMQLASGGAISGKLAKGFAEVFSREASIIVFTILLVVFMMVALRLTVGALIEKHRERPRYEHEEEPERPARAFPRTDRHPGGRPGERTGKTRQGGQAGLYQLFPASFRRPEDPGTGDFGADSGGAV